MLVLKCPKCGHSMKCQPRNEKMLAGKKKQCVYCGKSFAISARIIQRL